MADHPLKKILDDIWNSGLTPRVTVDATHDDVIFPALTKKKWGEQMNVDLEPAFHHIFDEEGITVDLTFQGTPMRCVIPWKRIYIIQGRDMKNSTGDRGYVIGKNAPPSFRKYLEKQLRDAAAATATHLSEPHAVGEPMTKNEAAVAGVPPAQVDRIYGGLRVIKGGKA